ncbi:MAG: aspartate aminotransferase family protein [Desulfurococcaceae archaeon]
MSTKAAQFVASKSAFIPNPEEIVKNAESLGYGPRSIELIKRALRVESLGAMPFSMYLAPPVIEKAYEEDAIVEDADGKMYIDMMAGFAVSNIGHHRRAVLEAIIEQFNKIVQYSEMLSEIRIKLGEKLVSITPGSFKKKVFYGLTGTDANEIAIKLARYYTGRTIIVTQWGDYHGRSIGTVPFTTSFSTWSQNYPLMGADINVVRIPFPYRYRCPCDPRADEDACGEACLNFVDYMLRHPYYGLCEPEKRLCNVAGFLVEPFQSAAGYIIPPDNWIPGLYKLSREHEILFIVDEIQTGWYRTGRAWATDHYSGVEPDLFLVAKSIANGLPFSAVIGRAEILDSWGPGAHSSTFAGYMLGCAAALKSIEIMEMENMAYQAHVKGSTLLKGLQDLMEQHPIVGFVEGRGLYIGIEFVSDRRTKKPAVKETAWMANRLLQLGMLVKRAGYLHNRFALSPPITITNETIDRALELFDKVFREAEEKFSIQKT